MDHGRHDSRSVEWQWLVPAATLTIGLWAFVLAFAPSLPTQALNLLLLWNLIAAILLATGLTLLILRMMVFGVSSPISKLGELVGQNASRLTLMILGFQLAGLNMIAFMWTKPLLNDLVSFSADPLLANWDKALFFGTQPFRLLTWLNSDLAAVLYSRLWFGMLLAALMLLLLRPSSQKRSALLITYFVLWTLSGPLIHCLLPAGGPIFFDRLGYGNEFIDLRSPVEALKLSEYLWKLYSINGFGPGAGISAMPSMHIATSVWVVFVIRNYAPTIVYVGACLLALLIFAWSISLGWHYAVDGVAGAILAWATLRVIELALKRYEIGGGTVRSRLPV